MYRENKIISLHGIKMNNIIYVYIINSYTTTFEKRISTCSPCRDRKVQVDCREEVSDNSREG